MTVSHAQNMGWNAGGYISSLIWQAAPWMLLAAVAGFVVALMVTFFLARRQLLRRHSGAWNVLAKLVYVVILLALPAGAGVLAGVFSVHHRINARIESDLRPLVAAQMPPLRMYLVREFKNAGSTKVTTIRELIKPFKQRFCYVPTSNGRWERTKRYWINDVMVEPSFTILADAIEDKLLEKLNKVGERVAGNDDTARMLLSLGAAILVKQNTQDPADALRFDREITEVVMSNLFKTMDKAFSPVYVSVWLPLLGITLLIVLEIILYRRYWWPGRASLQVSAMHPPLAR